MSTAQLRKRKSESSGTHGDTETEVSAVQTKEVSTDNATVVVSDGHESLEKLGLVSWTKKSFYINVFFPFWKHLDDRGFGTPQPFICWLLIPFTLSMFVWYLSVIELMDLMDWEAKMGPMPTWPEVEEEFKWGEL